MNVDYICRDQNGLVLEVNVLVSLIASNNAITVTVSILCVTYILDVCVAKCKDTGMIYIHMMYMNIAMYQLLVVIV